jgi:RNA polymerase sigma-70 factor (ECF subfamily)
MLALYCGDRGVAEELAQETLARACRDWKKVAAAASPEAWAHRVAINLAHSHFRRRAAARRAHERLRVDAERRPIQWPTERIELLEAMTALPHRQRSAVLLRYFMGFRVIEVAEILDCPEGTAKTLIHRALKALGRDLAYPRTEEASDAI